MTTEEKKTVALGQLREILAIVGALFFGTMTGWESITGLIVAVAAVAWGIWKHEGGDKLFSSIRKVLSVAPGVAVAFGWLPAEKEPLIAAMVIPLFSMIWSFKANGGTVDTGKIVPLLVFIMTLCFISCSHVNLDDAPSTVAIRGDITGVLLESDGQGGITPTIDRLTILKWFDKVGRIANGEEIKGVILDQK
ncbi:hypothetical protein OAB00_01290 [Akkermansiaceae bacterium]|nr:hypothetical protein [Akkermansiaceae bacterium]